MYFDNGISTEDQLKVVKAADWLRNNDPVVHSVLYHILESPKYALILIAEHGETIREKLEKIMDQIVISEEEIQKAEDEQRAESIKLIQLGISHLHHPDKE